MEVRAIASRLRLDTGRDKHDKAHGRAGRNR